MPTSRRTIAFLAASGAALLAAGRSEAQRYPEPGTAGPGLVMLPTLQDLRNQTGEIPVVFIAHHSRPRDAGGGFFIYDETSRDSDDDGVVVSSKGQRVGRWIRQIDDDTLTLAMFGHIPNLPAVDATPYFNRAMSSARRRKISSISFAAGNHFFNSVPEAIDFSLAIRGAGMFRTVLLRNFSTRELDVGLIDFRSGATSPSIEALSIVAAANTRGGCLLSLVADAGAAFGGFNARDLNVTTYGTNTHVYSIFLDGSQRVQQPAGLRALAFHNCQVFGGVNGAYLIKSCAAVNIIGGGTYPAGATGPAAGRIQITGTPQQPSENILIEMAVCGGFNLSHCRTVMIKVPSIQGDILNQGDAIAVSVEGNASGQVSQNWTRSRYTPLG